jgi:hypothetical protein
MSRCTKCGSRNHVAYDCSYSGPAYVPTPEDLAAEAAAAPPPPPPAPELEPMFEAARWPGGPQICSATNLPAHDSLEALERFHAANGPSCRVIKFGQCKVCSKWYAKTEAPHPQDSKGRSPPLPPGFVPFRRKVRASSFEGVQAQELPRQERAAEPESKKALASKPKRALKSRPLGELFGAAK